MTLGVLFSWMAIGFNNLVDVKKIDSDHIFQVLVEHDRSQRERGVICRCPVIGKIVPIKFNEDALNTGLITSTTRIDESPSAGVAFVFNTETAIGKEISVLKIRSLLVHLRGDFVLDTYDPPRAIDAEFVRGQLPTGDRPRGSKVGIQGGLFESWFTLKRQG